MVSQLVDLQSSRRSNESECLGDRNVQHEASDCLDGARHGADSITDTRLKDGETVVVIRELSPPVLLAWM